MTTDSYAIQQLSHVNILRKLPAGLCPVITPGDSETMSRAGASPDPDGSRAAGEAIDYGPLDNRLGYALRRAQLAVFRDFFNAFAELEIRPGQYSVLTIIEHNPGLSQTQVCDALGIQKANFVSVLDILVKRGLVSRRPTPNDRRSYALFLTTSGKLLMRKLHRISDQHEQRIIDRVGAENYRRMFASLQALTASEDERKNDRAPL
jgi:DNA-binding MarR family transcriptional regulator